MTERASFIDIIDALPYLVSLELRTIARICNELAPPLDTATLKAIRKPPPTLDDVAAERRKHIAIALKRMQRQP